MDLPRLLGLVSARSGTDPYRDIEVSEELLEFHGEAGNWWADGADPDRWRPGPPGCPAAPRGSTRSAAAPCWTASSAPGWRGPTPCRAQASPGPVSDGTTMVVAQQDGGVIARDVTLGTVTWRAAVPPPVVAAPVLAGRVVLVADGTRRLWALSAATGAALWVRRFDDVVSASPTVADTVAVVATDDGLVTVLDLTDGSTVWDREVTTRPRSGPALVGDVLVVTDPGGEVSAFDVDDGAPLWTRSLDAGIDAGPAAPAGDAGPVLVTDLNGTLHAYAVADGAELWGLRYPGRVPTHGGVRRRRRGHAGRGAGHGGRHGRRPAAVTCDVPQTDEPVTIVGDQAVLAGRVGQVLALDLRTGRTERSWRLRLAADRCPRVRRRTTRPGRRPAGLRRQRRGAGWHDPVGLPGRRRRGRPGRRLSLAGTVHPMDVSPTEPPGVVGDSTVLATGDSLVRQDPDGSTTTLATSTQGFQPGAVVRDGTAYVRVDDQLQAIDVRDGSVLWQVPAGPSVLGAPPSVSDDAVVFGVQDGGLARRPRDRASSLGRASPGRGLRRRAPAAGPTARSSTAAPAWRATTPRPATWSGRTRAPTSTGPRSRPAGWWSRPRPRRRRLGHRGLRCGDRRAGVVPAVGSLPSYVGPAAADGVVVAADGDGTVSAYDATSGSPLWRRSSATSLAGAARSSTATTWSWCRPGRPGG